MKAVLIYPSFETLGGGERLAITAIEALREMGFEVCLITLHRPRINVINRLFDTDIKIDKVKSVFVSQVDCQRWPIHLQIAPVLMTLLLCATTKADLILNAKGETILPWFSLSAPYSTFNSAPLVTYIHQPPVHELQSDNEYTPKYAKSFVWKVYFTSYRLIFGRILNLLEKLAIHKSTILTNSNFTKRKIKSLYDKVEPIVCRPPVDIDKFAQVLDSKQREDRILVVSRIDPLKQLEKTIEIVKLLPKNIKCTIVGTLSPFRHYTDYYMALKKKIECYDLDSRIEIKTNIESDEMLNLMAKSKIYLHTMPGEHFGISIVEAMAAGLIPVVPDSGGPPEFVPKKYIYHSLHDATQIIEKYINSPQSERLTLSEISKQFSEEKFKSKVGQIVHFVVYNSKVK